ncbi:zinc metalloprotease HtpX [Thioalkalicoccus limnaeus]|uniref:Zinc metalloprotease HtpX n=1 Tax=Thioalkalicoccus limnaeus TaxID=120681 RepID=A0ABV4BD38_9GAMM
MANRVRNLLQSVALIWSLAVLLGYLAWVIGGVFFAMAALGAVLVLSLASPQASPRLVLPLYHGRFLSDWEAPRIRAIVAELARRAGLSRVPHLYYIPSPVMNAFATGHRNESVIALSDGLLRRLTHRELAGVLAHEVSHIANDDIQVMAFADLVSRITNLLSLAGQVLLLISLPLAILTGIPIPWLTILVLVLAPTLSALVQLALSRNREYEADRRAAELSGDPEGLALALTKIERIQGPLWERILMPQRKVPDPSLLRTHPPTEDRIKRLIDLAPRQRKPLSIEIPQQVIASELATLLRPNTPLRPRSRFGGLWF